MKMVTLRQASIVAGKRGEGGGWYGVGKGRRGWRRKDGRLYVARLSPRVRLRKTCEVEKEAACA